MVKVHYTFVNACTELSPIGETPIMFASVTCILLDSIEIYSDPYRSSSYSIFTLSLHPKASMIIKIKYLVLYISIVLVIDNV